MQRSIVRDYLSKEEEDEAMVYIAERGCIPLLTWALEIGMNVHAGDDVGLVIAAKNGDLAIVDALLALGADIHASGTDHVWLEPDSADLAFRWAVLNNHIAVARKLLDAGADMDTPEPLWCVGDAVLDHQIDMVRMLLSRPGTLERFMRVGY